MEILTLEPRRAVVERTTGETEVKVQLLLDGGGAVQADTPVPFFNHMLSALGRHARFDMLVEAHGDVEIDDHHTVEDVGIVLGQALREALGEKRGIERYGYAYAPMDDALARAVVDLSGRAYLSYEAHLSTTTIGSVRPFQAELAEEFFRAFAGSALLNLHVDLIRGRNAHHAIEAIFKACAVALRMAVRRTGDGVPSTKGTL